MLGNGGCMLTPEDRQRIEEEERRKIAEEQYRAEVRAKLQGERPATWLHSPVLWIVGIGVVLIIGAFILTNRRSQPKSADGGPAVQADSRPAPVPKTRYVPASEKVATGQIVVKAQGYVQYRLMITPEMVEPTVTGTFNASGGTGNDIQAAIADEENYTNWINGHQAQVLWGTQGRQTTGNLEVRLQPGMYYLVFSNKFSEFTDKQVFLDVDLNYKRVETYY